MRKAVGIAGLFYGDEGKGTMTDFLVRHYKASLVVRYNGGCQAAHNVISPEGKHHTFSQLGSGSFAGAKSYLSQYMLIDPLALRVELEAFATHSGKYIIEDIIVSPGSVVITPFHKYLNQYRELARGDKRHTSVGVGVGEARKGQLEGKAILMRDLLLPGLEEKLYKLQNETLAEMMSISGDPFLLLRDHINPVRMASNLSPKSLAADYKQFARYLRMDTFDMVAKEHDVAVFEGAQGVMLDETHGWQPYTTWTDCTFGNFYKLLDEAAHTGEVERIGVIRTYLTRHGNGPLLTEDPSFNYREAHNHTHAWMGPMRMGHFDLRLLMTSLNILGSVDGFAVTHMDYPQKQICAGYSFIPEEIEGLGLTEAYLKQKPLYMTLGNTSFVEAIQRETRVPVLYTSYGPQAKDKYATMMGTASQAEIEVGHR